MSMLGAADNEAHSYLELVDGLRQYGSRPEHDCAQLGRPIVFNILISNTTTCVTMGSWVTRLAGRGCHQPMT
jgi:hypothetical protein